MKVQWKALIISLAAALGTGFLSTLLTPDVQENYAQLYRPPLAPPGWAFPVVWTILFVLMGIAAYLVFVSGKDGSQEALKWYLTQLVFNLGWSVIFFRWGAYLPAFLWLLILWYLVWTTRRKFGQCDRRAGLLMTPYLVWLTFAGYLNLAIALHYL